MLQFIKVLTMSQEELDQYYIKRRKEIYEKTGGIPKNIKFHNFMHYLLLPFMTLRRMLNGVSLHVCRDDREKTYSPIIYAMTHIRGDDVEIAFEVIKKPCYIFFGNPREVYRNIDGLFSVLNGVIFLETSDKYDRYIAKETAVNLLKKGGSLLIAPEGAWNIFHHLPVMKLFYGTAEIAIRSHADIIPIAIQNYGKDVFVSIGKNIKTGGFSIADKKALTQKLRDNMATLKWEIYEKQGVFRHTDLPADYESTFMKNIFEGNKDTSYTKQDVINTMFVDKNITEQQDAFSHLDKVQPKMQNAFLFNKRLK